MYTAVNKQQLIDKLGRQCSPDTRREGYVIGPDVTGRICHVASCFSLGEAQRYANELNQKKGENHA